jgi:thiosulfate/3-mercaptopyruvate sulfurtransferase
MKKIVFYSIVVLLIGLTAAFTISQTNTSFSGSEPWLPEQLMEPDLLAKKLTSTEKHPIIFNIGPSGVIKGAIDIGPGQEKANIEKLKKELVKLDKSTEIVVYCGCCPFKNCPNIRPAFEALNAAGLKNSFLLNLPENLRVDWIAKGYPMATNN